MKKSGKKSGILNSPLRLVPLQIPISLGSERMEASSACPDNLPSPENGSWTRYTRYMYCKPAGNLSLPFSHSVKVQTRPGLRSATLHVGGSITCALPLHILRTLAEPSTCNLPWSSGTTSNIRATDMRTANVWFWIWIFHGYHAVHVWVTFFLGHPCLNR